MKYEFHSGEYWESLKRYQKMHPWERNGLCELAGELHYGLCYGYPEEVMDYILERFEIAYQSFKRHRSH